jgi:hypothetical protein
MTHVPTSAMDRPRAKEVGAALVTAPIFLLPVDVIAPPQRLDCKLSWLETQAGPNSVQRAEDRSTTVAFDEQAQTLTVNLDGSAQVLSHVTFILSALSGFTGDISLGIDRGSWRVVLQTYKAGSKQAEFGTCSLSPAGRTGRLS